MGDHCHWEAKELDPLEPLNETVFPKHRKGIWLLKTPSSEIIVSPAQKANSPPQWGILLV
jgi:hypothetical protein